MEIKCLGKMEGGQDGAIWGQYLFRFSSDGFCRVYDLNACAEEETCLSEVASFWLDRVSVLAPHSNAVVFGTQYYSEEDEFPLLYTNIYNNYAAAEKRYEGMCCVYRIYRTGDAFRSDLVQVLEIGFVKDSTLWCSGWEKGDVRPYGNFVIDRESNRLYAFTMRDEENTTRYFSLRLPHYTEGNAEPQFGVPRYVLTNSDLAFFFDCDYHRYLQGACVHAGLIYTVEGFTGSAENPPALRIVDPGQKCQKRVICFGDYGLTVEPELIDFLGDTCIYSDGEGNLFSLNFEK